MKIKNLLKEIKIKNLGDKIISIPVLRLNKNIKHDNIK